MATRPTALGAHVYAGGFTLGVMKHFDVVGHVEELNLALSHARANFTFPITLAPSTSWPTEQVPDLLYGNPPCHGFSAINMMVKREDRCGYKDNVYMQNFVAYSLRLRPPIAVFEMVPGLLTVGRPLLSSFSSLWQESGYAVTVVKTAAALHGVPQLRRRIFVIAHRVLLSPPPPSRGPLNVTVFDAISDLENQPLDDGCQPYVTAPRSEYQERLRADTHSCTNHRSTPTKWDPFIGQLLPGHSLSELPQEILDEHFRGADKRARGVAAPGSFLFKTAPNKRAGVVGGQCGQFHYKHDRLLTIREAARLMAYPDWFVWQGNYSKQHQGIGKAISPLVGEWLAGWLVTAIEDSKPCHVPMEYYFDLTKGVR